MAPNPVFGHPLVIFVVCAIVLWGSAWLGASLRKRELDEVEQADLGLIIGATLTLLGLIIGFSFSMATTRYDQRKNLEEGEANAIGTELLRADLLPNADAAVVSGLLRAYLGLRITSYGVHDLQFRQLENETERLEAKLWTAVRLPATRNPTPLSALVVAGMNDVLNARGYTDAAWRNRIPTAAWSLMVLIAVCSNVLVGFSSHRTKQRAIVLFIVPALASIAFLLIADLDSPRGGLIRVNPDNLVSLSQSLHGQ